MTSILDMLVALLEDVRDLTADSKRMEIQESLDEIERLIEKLRTKKYGHEFAKVWQENEAVSMKDAIYEDMLEITKALDNTDISFEKEAIVIGIAKGIALVAAFYKALSDMLYKYIYEETGKPVGALHELISNSDELQEHFCELWPDGWHGCSTLAVPPGETILEMLEDRNIPADEFCSKMHISKDEMNMLLEGKMRITERVAEKLEKLLDVPASFWVNLEANYRLEKASEQNENHDA